MAWKTHKPKGASKRMYRAYETYTLPASATREYSSVIDFVEPNTRQANRRIAVSLNASAVTGTNLDIALYGSGTLTGTKVLLVDTIVADITATGRVTGVVDLNSYPSNYYWIAWTSDADESLNTIDVEIEATSREYLL